MENNHDRLLTSGEVAKIFGVNVRTIWRWARARKIPYTRVPGGAIRYSEREMLAIKAGAYRPAEED